MLNPYQPITASEARDYLEGKYSTTDDEMERALRTIIELEAKSSEASRPTLSMMYAVHDALMSLTFDEFCDAMAKAHGRRDESYARGVWIPFRDMPIWFLKSRQPQSQAKCILAAALQKAGL
jgi:hypothetical protein